jgi:hypothetical protein
MKITKQQLEERVRARRQRALQVLAESRAAADPRYVAEVAGVLLRIGKWSGLFPPRTLRDSSARA